MRRQILPVGLAIGVGLLVLLHFLVKNSFLDTVTAHLISWAAIVAAFAVLLGLFNVASVHIRRVLRHEGNGWSSAVILVSAVLVFIVALPSGGASQASGWVLRYLYQPLEASFLALLVFFIAAAAYRALRARTGESLLLVVAALVVLIGSVPASNLISPALAGLKEWVLNVPAVAGVRGILIGVALGVLATGVRLLSGIDRPYSE